MVEGLYFDASIARYFFAALMLLLLAGSSLLKGGHSLLLRAHAATWLLLAFSQLAWAVPVMLSQSEPTLFYAGVIGFSLYFMSAIGAAVAFSTVFLTERKLASRLVIGGSVLFAVAGVVVAWLDHAQYPPVFSLELMEVDKEHLFIFRIFFAVTLSLFLPVGIYILRSVVPRLSGLKKLVAIMDGCATAVAALSGLILLVGYDDAVVPIFVVLSLMGLIMIAASWLRRKQGAVRS